MTPRPVLRYLWAAPVTLIGVLVAVVARMGGATWARRDGVLEVTGGVLRSALPRLGVGVVPVAVALGHVILAVDAPTLDRIRAHEQVHVRQAEHWGALFPFAYLAASIMAVLRGEHFYRDNRFEREARRAERHLPADLG